ncbi:DUF4325 domain-containing protein [Verminephrobacter aporrectodeae subsp. tuberculatae]|uniref:DUF4325 domain-containing protein n=1 Tax=Verminephrobacter aporrectodeae subsp. tuberculatae TaxID=1110392 RepID=A0ABT3KMU8_9BURK|nr:STAS-like domain-containing protein [Verminephrobacter aporrectodeae]MCW5319646.1 DUF4325 domain-containing protein [Verminephrobacter aporrectodeae subsp. tuberculatae]
MTTLCVAKHFSSYPGGRFKRISEFSGEEFRDDFLAPAIRRGDKVVVELDGVVGYGSSFLEEVFGGIVRTMHWTDREQVNKHLKIESSQESWIFEVNQYIDEALECENSPETAQKKAIR